MLRFGNFRENENNQRQVHDFSSDVNKPVAPASQGGELPLCQHRLFHLTKPGAGAVQEP